MSEGVLLLGGPTASGKSTLAVALAERFGAEIIGADSRQIYRNMPIGTAVPSPDLRARVAHHLLEFLEPAQRYSAAQFAHDAIDRIEQLSAAGKRVIVAGGTGFYLRALSGDVVLSDTYDPDVRLRLAREASVHCAPVLHAWLASRAPNRAASIDPNDTYRITRALEIALATKTGGETSNGQPSLRQRGIPSLKVWLDISIDRLEFRIAERVDRMIAEGFVAEAERIGPAAVAADAVGYPLAIAFASGLLTSSELRFTLIRATRRYAKRQRTWFRGETEAQAIEANDLEAAFAQVEVLARERLAWT